MGSAFRALVNLVTALGAGGDEAGLSGGVNVVMRGTLVKGWMW